MIVVTGTGAADVLGDAAPARRPSDRRSRSLGAEARVALAAVLEADPGFGAGDTDDVAIVCGTVTAGLHDYVSLHHRLATEGVAAVSPTQGPLTGLNAPAGQLAIWGRASGPNLTVTAGVSSGLEAVARSWELLRLGQARAALAVAVERALPGGAGDVIRAVAVRLEPADAATGAEAVAILGVSRSFGAGADCRQRARADLGGCFGPSSAAPPPDERWCDGGGPGGLAGAAALVEAVRDLRTGRVAAAIVGTGEPCGPSVALAAAVPSAKPS